MMVDTDLGSAEPGEVFLSHVSARAIEAVCLLMVDSLDLETLMQIVSRGGFVGVHSRTLRDPRADKRCGWAF
jgi:hypothetical protein